MRNHFKKQKMIACLLVVIFSFTTVAWSAPEMSLSLGQMANKAYDDLLVENRKLQLLPADIASVTKVYQAKENSPIVFHLQDAHASLEAQENIHRALNQLVSEQQIEAVFIEGAIGTLDAKMLSIDSKEKDYSATLKKLKEYGVIGGIESFILENSQLPFHVFGVEDARLYVENLKDYQDVLEFKKQTSEVMGSVKSKLISEASKTLNVELYNFFKRWSQFKQDQRNFVYEIDFLIKKAKEKLSIDFDEGRAQLDWPHLARLVKIRKWSSQIEYEKIEIEKQALEVVLNGMESKAALSFFQKFNVENNFNPSITVRLRESLEQLYASDSRLAPQLYEKENLRKLLGLRILEEELDVQKLAEEMETVAEQIFDVLVKNKSESKFLSRFRQSLLIEKLLKLELSSDDFEKVQRIHNMKEFVFRYSASEEQAKVLAGVLEKAGRFYEHAKQRDQVMFKRMSKQIKESKMSSVVLITGGFHALGMESLMVEAGYSFFQIAPRISKIEESSSYENIVTLQGHNLLGRNTIDAPSIMDTALPQSLPQYAQMYADLVALAKREVRDVTVQAQDTVNGRAELRSEEIDFEAWHKRREGAITLESDTGEKFSLHYENIGQHASIAQDIHKVEIKKESTSVGYLYFYYSETANQYIVRNTAFSQMNIVPEIPFYVDPTYLEKYEGLEEMLVYVLVGIAEASESRGYVAFGHHQVFKRLGVPYNYGISAFDSNRGYSLRRGAYRNEMPKLSERNQWVEAKTNRETTSANTGGSRSELRVDLFKDIQPLYDEKGAIYFKIKEDRGFKFENPDTLFELLQKRVATSQNAHYQNFSQIMMNGQVTVMQTEDGSISAQQISLTQNPNLIAELQKAYPGFLEVYFATFFASIDEVDQAKAYFKSSYEQDPFSQSTIESYLGFLEEIEDDEELLNIAREVTENYPSHAKYQKNIGVVLMKLGRTDEALPYFTRAYALYESADLEFTVMYLNALQENGDYEQMSIVLKEMLDQKTSALPRGEIKVRLARVLNILGRRGQATALLDESIDEVEQRATAEADDVVPTLILLTSYMQNSRFMEARQLAQEALKKWPNHLRLLHHRARAALFLRELDVVIEIAEQVVGLEELDAEGRHSFLEMQAMAYSKKGDKSSLEKGEVIARDLKEAAPEIAFNHLRHADILQQMSRFDEAEEVYQRALDLIDGSNQRVFNGTDTRFNLYYSLGSLYQFKVLSIIDTMENLEAVTEEMEIEILGLLEQSELYYMQAKNLNAKDANTLFNLAKVLSLQAKLEESVDVFEDWVDVIAQKEENDRLFDMNMDSVADAYDDFGDVLNELGREKEAESMWAKADQIRSELRRVEENYAVVIEVAQSVAGKIISEKYRDQEGLFEALLDIVAPQVEEKVRVNQIILRVELEKQKNEVADLMNVAETLNFRSGASHNFFSVEDLSLELVLATIPLLTEIFDVNSLMTFGGDIEKVKALKKELLSRSNTLDSQGRSFVSRHFSFSKDVEVVDQVNQSVRKSEIKRMALALAVTDQEEDNLSKAQESILRMISNLQKDFVASQDAVELAKQARDFSLLLDLLQGLAVALKDVPADQYAFEIRKFFLARGMNQIQINDDGSFNQPSRKDIAQYISFLQSAKAVVARSA